MPASRKKYQNQLVAAIKSLLPRADGHFAYDCGWDDAFDPMEHLASGKQDDIQKPSLGQAEQASHHSAGTPIEPDESGYIPLTLAQVRQQTLHAAAKTAADDAPSGASPTQPRKLKPRLLNLYIKAPASPRPARAQPQGALHRLRIHAAPRDDDTISEDSSACPSACGSSASLQLEAVSDCSSCSSCTLV